MDIIEQAKNVLVSGKLVAIPTETVYGIGADAKNPTAIQKIYTAKGRPPTNPLIIHIPSRDAMEDWALDIPETAQVLAKAFWPGPLTLILKRHPNTLKILTGGQETVALRIPNHPLTLALLKRFNSGIAAPSANRSGKISPTTAAHVAAELGTSLDYILDGGPCVVGIESTIVSLVDDTPMILREGSISRSALEKVLQKRISAKKETSIEVPGSALSHYAPSQPLYLLETDLLLKRIKELADQNISVSVISFSEKPEEFKIPPPQWIFAPKNPEAYAKQLYANLHLLDKIEAHCILVEAPPNTEPWLAIIDRLQRAAYPIK